MHTYDQEIARHYAAYRPPLHRLIVGEVLDGQQFDTGLDIGCGTGYSAIALVDKCERIFAVDHSQAMLDRATKNPKVTYLFGSGDDLPINDASVDLVTFSGVLSYLNAEHVVVELKRVCRSGALVVPYDFEVILGDLMRMFSLAETDVDGTYDHACNLSDQAEISTLKQASRVAEISVSEQQAAHILLSDMSRYDRLAALLESSNPFDPVIEILKQEKWSGMLKAKIYYSLHRLDN